MQHLRHDLRQAVRSLAQRKGLTLAALISLALGIGANTALFSVAYGVLLRPLPYPDAERLVRLSEVHPGASSALGFPLLSSFTLHPWQEQTSTLEGVAAYSTHNHLETSGQKGVRLRGASVSPALFRILGSRPVAGRLLIPEDAREGSPPVTVLSHGLWQSRFGGDPSAVGESLILDGESHLIVGVAAPELEFPDRNIQAWTSYFIPPPNEDPEKQSIRVFPAIGLLRPGVSPQTAAAEGTLHARREGRPAITNAIFGQGGPPEIKVRNLRLEMTDQIRPAVQLLLVGVGFILLICCANVTNLLLSRGVSRRREWALRAALGASRRRLLSMALTEGLVLSVLGGGLGLALGAGLLRILPAVAPADFPRLEDIHLDSRAVAFSLLATVVAGILSASLPAWRAARTDVLPALGSGTTGNGSGRRSLLGRGLLATEAALAVVLLVASGLLLHSFARLTSVDTGYDPNQVLLAQVSLSQERPPEVTAALVNDLLSSLRNTSGVEAAGAANMAPFSNSTAIQQFSLDTEQGEPIEVRALSYVVTPGYAQALKLRLREGRSFEPSDIASGTRGMIVNEEFVRQYLSDGRPVVGRRLPNMSSTAPEDTVILGVVSNVLKGGLDGQPQSAIYHLPVLGHSLSSDFHLLLRTSGDPMAVLPALRAQLTRADPLAVVDAATLNSHVSDSLGQPRFAAVTIAAFALLALVMAATGLYGVLSHSVSQRVREMGIRSALGASRGSLVSLIIRQGLAVTSLGLVVGISIAALTSRWLQSLLFEVPPLDPIAFSAAPLLLLAVAFVACWMPARRAASTAPTEALRSD
ncbi:MAG: ABC transporter permease [Deltaproteobacteria bacterium]|nr:ABC transporter permease [Deltaproteobacteria bacterium]